MIVAVVIGLILAAIVYFVLARFIPQLFAALAALLTFVLCIGGGS